MSLPTMTGTARLIDDPELRFAAGSGKAVVKVRLAFNARKKDPSGEWVDGDSFFVDGAAFDQLAQNIADTLQKGMEVVVSGRLRTDRWETKQGEKRSGTSLLVDSIGPSLRYATAAVTKAGGGRQAFEAVRQQSAGSGDPWTQSSQQAGQQGGSGWGSEEPPF